MYEWQREIFYSNVFLLRLQHNECQPTHRMTMVMKWMWMQKKTSKEKHEYHADMTTKVQTKSKYPYSHIYVASTVCHQTSQTNLNFPLKYILQQLTLVCAYYRTACIYFYIRSQLEANEKNMETMSAYKWQKQSSFRERNNFRIEREAKPNCQIKRGKEIRNVKRQPKWIEWNWWILEMPKKKWLKSRM